jgi:hypothetical protein
MPARPDVRGGATSTFVVECFWPEITEQRVREALFRVAPRWATGDPVDEVRSLGGILVPSDGMVLFLFRGPSEELIRERSTLAESPCTRSRNRSTSGSLRRRIRVIEPNSHMIPTLTDPTSNP